MSKVTKRQQKRIDNHLKNMEKSERKQQLRKANKKMRRNVSSKGARRKDWFDVDAVMDGDYDDFERIMPLDESDRRRNVEQMAYQTVDEPPEDIAIDEDLVAGRVIETSKGLCRVQIDERVVLCSLRGNLDVAETGFTNAVAVGDDVYVREDGVGGGVVERVMPRRSFLARPDVFNAHLLQVLVANIDQMLIVASWREPHLWPELIDRYLVVAARNDLPAMIGVNKIDLVEDAGELDTTLRPYRQLEIPVVLTSTLTGVGVNQLHQRLIDQTTVLTGLSGVGKSSLISAVDPNLDLRTGSVGDAGGRHTTTQANWLPLAAGGAVVDTPGIREFGLSGLVQDELIEFMPDLAELAAGCRFNDCRHLDEPGCAVRAAVAAGELAESRHFSYTKMLRELPE